MTKHSDITPDERVGLLDYLKLFDFHRGESKTAYDAAAPGYDGFASVWDKKIAGGALNYFNELLKEKILPGASVLDAGAGTGLRTSSILEVSDPGRVVALDSSVRMLDVARKRIEDPRVEFMEGDVTKLPFEDDTFDVVCCTWVVEILDDPRRGIEEFIRVIKPEGVVVYAFCSLPEGPLGRVLDFVIQNMLPADNPLTHLLPTEDQPFHQCDFSSLKRFSGGLTSVATVGKCCEIRDPSLPCRLELSVLEQQRTL